MPSDLSATVLLVARQPDSEQELSHLLQEAGLHVAPVATMTDALAQLEHAAVILLAGPPLDVPLAELCRQLRQRAPSPAPPVLLLADQPPPEADLDAILLRPFC